MLYVLLALIITTAIVLWYAISRGNSAVTLSLEKLELFVEVLNQKLESIEDSLNEKLDKLQESTDEIEYRTLTVAEKEHRKFQQARCLTLSDVEIFKEGQTLTLISCSYYYPSDKPSVDTFEYRHERLGAPIETGKSGESAKDTKSYTCVHGFVRWDPAQEWDPYTFHAARDECVTSTHEGTIRRL
jgi:hypothetical protein